MLELVKFNQNVIVIYIKLIGLFSSLKFSILNAFLYLIRFIYLIIAAICWRLLI